MSRMPDQFFDEDVMGAKAKEFLGCKTSTGVNTRCLLGGIALAVLGIGIIATPLMVFKS